MSFVSSLVRRRAEALCHYLHSHIVCSELHLRFAFSVLR